MQERFWGLPWWSSRLVLLTEHAFREGETYLIDETRDPRLLNRFLPIVEAGHCTVTAPLAHATVQLRLLREARSAAEVRVAGIVVSDLEPEPREERPTTPDFRSMSDAQLEEWRQKSSYSSVAYRRPFSPLAGARIRVSGSKGSVIVTSDRDGVYEVAGLAPDDYKLELVDLPNTQHAVNATLERGELIRHKVVWKSLCVYWNGTIEGRVKPSSNGPGKVGLRLERTDGRWQPMSENREAYTGGEFRFEPLAPGRYRLRVNPSGLGSESPFAPEYYPGAMSGAAGLSREQI